MLSLPSPIGVVDVETYHTGIVHISGELKVGGLALKANLRFFKTDEGVKIDSDYSHRATPLQSAGSYNDHLPPKTRERVQETLRDFVCHYLETEAAAEELRLAQLVQLQSELSSTYGEEATAWAKLAGLRRQGWHLRQRIRELGGEPASNSLDDEKVMLESLHHEPKTIQQLERTAFLAFEREMWKQRIDFAKQLGARYQLSGPEAFRRAEAMCGEYYNANWQLHGPDEDMSWTQTYEARVRYERI